MNLVSEKMKGLSLRPEFYIPISCPRAPLCMKPVKLVVVSCGKHLKHPPLSVKHKPRKHEIVIMGAVCAGILAVVMSEEKAWALGPEGPLVEEFWDNVRRYGLYALTVSTGALYTILRPIVDLLKNPISAILIIALFGGSIFIVSQVLSAMVGVSEFSYDYGY